MRESTIGDGGIDAFDMNSSPVEVRTHGRGENNTGIASSNRKSIYCGISCDKKDMMNLVLPVYYSHICSPVPILFIDLGSVKTTVDFYSLVHVDLINKQIGAPLHPDFITWVRSVYAFLNGRMGTDPT